VLKAIHVPANGITGRFRPLQDREKSFTVGDCASIEDPYIQRSFMVKGSANCFALRAVELKKVNQVKFNVNAGAHYQDGSRLDIGCQLLRGRTPRIF
jgi:hypothetical protein